MSDFYISLVEVLKREGGWVDNKNDPGGATNLGVSLRYLLSRGDLDHDGLPDGDLDHDGDIDADDIRKMTEADAAKIYRTGWWDKYAYGTLRAQEVATKVFDMSVNMGARQAHLLLQRACNDCRAVPPVVDDGVVGPATYLAANGLYPEALCAALRQRCLAYYHLLIDRNPKLEVFRKGWERRALT